MFWSKLCFINISPLSPIIHVLLLLWFWHSSQEWGWCFFSLKLSELLWLFYSSLQKNCRNESRWFLKLDHEKLCGFLFVGWNVMLGYETCSHHVNSPFSLRPSSCEVRLRRLTTLRCPANLLLPWTPAAPATLWLQPNRKFWARAAQPSLSEFLTQKPWKIIKWVLSF